MKKLILLSIFAILVTLSPAQTISFSGYQRSTYQHPMQINNHWDAWYINSDILPFQGEIIIHDKSFEVYFTNGQSWIATTKKKKTQYGEQITCKCGRIFIHDSKTGKYRRALLEEV